MVQLSFHGAAQTVTGSRHLVRCAGESLLVDCGMFQGLKQLRLQNWEPTPFSCSDLDAVALTHCHIDHCGFLPRIVRQGFRGQVFCTRPTAELLPIMLQDTAKLLMEDTRFFNKHGLTRHKPALPLFTLDDVKASLKLLVPVDYGRTVKTGKHIEVRCIDAGHILGSASVEVTARDDGRSIRILFSGDIGNYDSPLPPDPERPRECDYLVIESTYGDRLHDDADPHAELQALVTQIARRGGILLIPAFAVGRSQQILFILKELQNARRIPAVPIYLDSPMAFKTSEVFLRYLKDHSVQMDPIRGGGSIVGPNVKLCRTPAESRRLSEIKGPAIIISASGMMAGGRVLSHAARLLPLRSTIVVFAGYQAEGTRGRALLEGRTSVRIRRQTVPVRAQVTDLAGLSGHADYRGLLQWTSGLPIPPRKVFVTHGEPRSAEHFASLLRTRRQWDAVVPSLHESVTLS